MPTRLPLKTLLIIGAALCSPGLSALAQTTMPAAAPTMAKPAKALMGLKASDADPAMILAPPPVDGSAAQRDDLARLQAIYKNRSAERLAIAQWDDVHEDPMIFASTIGPAFDLKKLPKTARLLAVLNNDQSIIANNGKAQFKRLRGYTFDASIKPCTLKAGADPRTSYPSGHATLGYSLGYVLAQLIPSKAPALLSRAQEYGESRVVCGSHYPSDIEASHVLGTAIGIKILAEPKLATMVTDARAELRAAGLN